jgi:hypothetical protein
MWNIQFGTSLYDVRCDLGYYLALPGVILTETPLSYWDSEEKVTTELILSLLQMYV